MIYSTTVLWNMLDDNDRKILGHFVQACNLLVTRIITEDDLKEVQERLKVVFRMNRIESNRIESDSNSIRSNHESNLNDSNSIRSDSIRFDSIRRIVCGTLTRCHTLPLSIFHKYSVSVGLSLIF